MSWTPITFEELYDKVLKTEWELNGQLLNFWEMIKFGPEKWMEQTYGKEGGGFWVVAVVGHRVIYYNDIEEGFNISKFTKHGTIDEYWCNQDDLGVAVKELFGLIEFGGNIGGQAGPPI
jgi:hypothetical protein